MEKRWVIRKRPGSEILNKLSSEINVNADLAALLVQREVYNYSEARAFFRPSMSELHDPFLMKDMDKAVDRLCQAIAKGEKVLVFGDYDVDGTTAVATFFDFFSRIHSHTLFYIPDRYKEGYGISKKGIDFAADEGVTLVVSLDCGIKSVDLVKYAATKNIDFIICDHHQPGEQLPEAVAVLDPKRSDCPYPYKELSGCGVGFKLMQAISIQGSLQENIDLQNYLDLVAVSIASDIVPITGENRILAFFGLQVLNTCPRPGLQALLEVAGLDRREIDITDVVFGIGPRINAAGRIAHAKAAVELMLCSSKEEAADFARNINKNNTTRRDVDASITSQALEMIEGNEQFVSACSTVLYKEDWHKGVIGIVASRCIEKYYRPTVIFTKSGEVAAGSARSVVGFDLYDALEKCSDLLIQFGGHMYAAGMTIEPDKIAAFREKFEQVVSESITKEQLVPQVDIDLEIGLNRVTEKFYNIIRQMGPFGPGNMQPVFISRNVVDCGGARLLKDQHIKLSVMQEDSDVFDAIGFGMPEFYERIKNGEMFDICYCVSENNYNGRKSLQLMIKDIKFGNEKSSVYEATGIKGRAFN
ncbi:single-stranded-DNA-specific exonuclease RecJ [Cytophagaceae bacterium ABcell3]|nr:single-stranded-DNA-specific exonuclease RecJ [Cytophagaceae bacterium ABcell3]